MQEMEKESSKKVVSPEDAAAPNPTNVIVENVKVEPQSGSMIADGDPMVSALFSDRVVDEGTASKQDTSGRVLPNNEHAEMELFRNVDGVKTAGMWEVGYYLPGMPEAKMGYKERDLLEGLCG